MEQLTSAANKWTLPHKIFFRFFFVYFLLICFPFPLNAFDFTRPIYNPYQNMRNWGYSQMGHPFYFNLLTSILLSIIWSLIDRHRTNYEKLDQWLRLYLRYFLAFFMLGYGFNKVFNMQAPPITVSRIALPYGMQKPSRVFFHFLAYSNAFEQFTGWMEVIGSLFLLWRRTVTIGAIVLLSMMSAVVIVNFGYDIRVRYISLHFLLITIYLLWNDRKRLVNLFFLNKPAEAVAYSPLISHPLWRKIFMYFLLVLIACNLYKHITDNIMYIGWGKVPRPLDGIYNTEYFIRGTDTIPPLQTDSLRWKKLIVDIRGEFLHLSHVQLSTDTIQYCNTKVDTVNKVISFQFKDRDGFGKIQDSCLMNYSLPDSSHLYLQGIWKKDSIKVMMKKYDLNNYPLYREKFNWKIDKSAI